MKLVPNNITLEKVKNSNLWELIALIVWNHYREERYQEENMIAVSEDWCGKSAEGGTISYSSDWNNPEHAENNLIRTLQSIQIKFTRTDYVVYISIKIDTGNISVFGIYTDKENKKNPHFYYGNIDVTNWMLENNLLKIEN